MSRPVSARRVLAVVAAVVALPWPLLVLAYAADDEPILAAIAALTIAVIVATPLFARRRRFGALAGAVCLLLLLVGVVAALAGGFLVWPGAFLFLAAAAPARETGWRPGRVVAVAGAVVGVCAAVAGAVLVVSDVRDEPDLAVRLRPDASLSAFTERALSDPHVSSIGSGDPVQVELVDGLTPGMRGDTVAALRRSPEVVSVRVDD